jgi:proton-translocating NADH-quinone oxidoreductase chain N
MMNAALQNSLNEIFPSAAFYLHASPILALLIGALVALLAGVFRGNPDRPNMLAYQIGFISCFPAVIVPLILLSAPMSFGLDPAQPPAWLGSGFLGDQISQFTFLIVGLGTMFTLIMAEISNAGRQLLRPELICLLMFASAGIMIMAAAGEFLAFFTGLELMSVSLYVLVGYQRADSRGLEAAVKYFLMGATASGIILMGMALIYLNIGTLRWADLRGLNISLSNPFAVIGLLMFVVGLAFKLGIAPFHTWGPDVYQGAHSTLTGYMSTLVKVGIVMVMLRVLGNGFVSADGGAWVAKVFWALAALSILIGSVFGLVHNSVKRMLAYSSIANAGYFCLAFATLALAPQSAEARQAVLAYTVIYTILNLGTFAVLAWLEDNSREDLLKEELAGLGKKSPFVAVCLTVFILGLAGIPPAAGFFGKFLLINSAVSVGLVGLAIVMVVLSCISLFYYLSVLVEIWLKPSTRSSVNPQNNEDAREVRILVGIVAAASLVIGIVGPRWIATINPTFAADLRPAKAAVSSDSNIPPTAASTRE